MLFLSDVIERSLPIACSDHTGPLFEKVCVDCKIVSLCGSTSTRITAILGFVSKSTTNYC